MGNQTETDMDVSCLVNLDKFYKCCGVTHQFGSVYRQEEFDNCSHKFDDFKNCIMAKTVSSEEKRKMYSKKSIPKPAYENTVFQLKEHGSWC